MKSFKSVVNSSNVDAVRKTLNVAQWEIKEAITIRKNFVYQKYVELISWYNKFIGLEELKKYQNQVTELQEKLFLAQENRRKIGHELSEIRNRSHEIQDQLHKVNRQNNINQFLDLLKEETEIMKKEQEIASNFNYQDRCERDIFTAFTNAIHNAHEKQRAQLEYTKYFGIFISFLGSFLSFVYSSIKKEDLKYAVEKNMEAGFEPIKEKMEKNFDNIESSFLKMQQILKLYEQVLNGQSDIKSMEEDQVEDGIGNGDKLMDTSYKILNILGEASQEGYKQALKVSKRGLVKVRETLVQEQSVEKELSNNKLEESARRANEEESLRTSVMLEQHLDSSQSYGYTAVKSIVVAAICILTLNLLVR